MPLYRAELLAKKPLRYPALIHNVSQVLHLPFDYDDGSYARDRSGYNNHGTIYGATLATGKIGMGRKFDGTDDYVEVPHSSSLEAYPPLTVIVWHKVLGFPNGIKPHAVVGKHYAGTQGFALIIEQKKYGYVFMDGTTHHLYLGPDAELGKWVQHGFIHDGTEGLLVINGKIVEGSAIKASLVPSTINLNLGRCSYHLAEHYEGVIDEVRWSKTPLSQDEIRKLMYRRF